MFVHAQMIAVVYENIIKIANLWKLNPLKISYSACKDIKHSLMANWLQES